MDSDEVAVSEEGSVVSAEGAVVEASVLDTADGTSVFSGSGPQAARDSSRTMARSPAILFFIFKSSHFSLNPLRLSREGYGYIFVGDQSYIE